jgi:predicted GIY-YIG superfamily endonuclease
MISIYKIVDNTNGNIYVGSTQQLLKNRKKHHESKYNMCSSREIIKNNDYYFELIEECEEDKR